MALLDKYKVKTVVGNIQPQLTAPPGKSYLVTDIRVENPATNYATIKVDKTTAMYIRAAGPQGGHMRGPYGPASISANITVDPITISSPEYAQILNAAGAETGAALAYETAPPSKTTIYAATQSFFRARPPSTLLAYLRDKGIFTGIPIAEGETLTIEGLHHDNSTIEIIYEEYEAQDITNTLPNGSAAQQYTFINYGRPSANITATGDTLYTTAQTTAEFPDFPYSKTVPTKHDALLHGIAIAPVIKYNTNVANYIRTTFLKLVKDRTVLFDDDRHGIPLFAMNYQPIASTTVVAMGQSQIGAYSDQDTTPPLIFDPPIQFKPGDELNVYLTTQIAGTGATLNPADVEVALIMTMKPTE